MERLVITAVGEDRPGLVDEFTGKLLDDGCNLADSRMVNLRGQFALIMLVEAPSQTMAQINTSITDVGRAFGLTVTLGPQLDRRATQSAGLPLRIKAYTMDQPGIVHRITHVLYQHNINIEELETRLAPGSYTGTPLFNLDLRMTVPADVSVKELRAEVEQLCESLNCDVKLHSI